MFRKLLEKYYLWRYVRVGTEYGDYVSYSFMGDPPYWLRRRYYQLEEKIEKLGYTPLGLRAFELHGGYGKPLPPISRKSITPT
jgi:hypothetical protein